MVNLKKWEEVDFFDIRVRDEIKAYIEVSPTLTHVVRGPVQYTNFLCDRAEGHIRLLRKGVYHNLRRNPDIGKPDGTTLYRRKAKPFNLPTELGAIVSGIPAGAINREWCVFDGCDWSSSARAYLPNEMLDHFADLRLEREGIEQTP